jgi:predicted kinase
MESMGFSLPRLGPCPNNFLIAMPHGFDSIKRERSEAHVLIAMAGLPGTGKSGLAGRLAAKLRGIVLNKDEVRAAMFPAIDYSREQDDAVVAAIYARAHRILCTTGEPVIIDGRTFSRAYQVRDLFRAAETIGTEPRIIECLASDGVVRERLERDQACGEHPAKNRTFQMYLEVKTRAEPLTVPRLTLDTGRLSFEECVDRSLEYLASGTNRIEDSR